MASIRCQWGHVHATVAEVRACAADRRAGARRRRRARRPRRAARRGRARRAFADRPTPDAAGAAAAAGDEPLATDPVAWAGPDWLGRDAIVAPGQAVPGPWAAAPVGGRRRPPARLRAAALGAALGAAPRPPAHRVRGRTVDLPAPAVADRPGWTHPPDLLLADDVLTHLVTSNAVDLRPGRSPWPWADRAVAAGARLGGPADVVLPDGTPAWCDGGPPHAVRRRRRRGRRAPGRPRAGLAHADRRGRRRRRRAGPGSGRRRRPPGRIGARHRPGRFGQDPRPHRAGPAPARRLARPAVGAVPGGVQHPGRRRDPRAHDRPARPARAHPERPRPGHPRRPPAVRARPARRPPPRRAGRDRRARPARHAGHAGPRRRHRSHWPRGSPPWARSGSACAIPAVVEADYGGDVDGLPGRWSSATASALAERGAVDFDEQIIGAIELLLARRRGAGRRPAGRAASSWSTSSRTWRPPTSSCCASWPAPSCRSSAWATTTRPSTASPAPPPSG